MIEISKEDGDTIGRYKNHYDVGVYMDRCLFTCEHLVRDHKPCYSMYESFSLQFDESDYDTYIVRCVQNKSDYSTELN